MTRSRHARRASERAADDKFNPEIRCTIALPLPLGIYTEVLMTLPLPAVACKGCQKEFFPRKKMYSTYCSRDCAFQFKAAAPYSRAIHRESSACVLLGLVLATRQICESASRKQELPYVRSRVCPDVGRRLAQRLLLIRLPGRSCRSL
jgi:hypothetical protein